MSPHAKSQTWNGTTSSSAFGSGGFGSSGFGNAGFGASRFGSAGNGQTGFGTSGFGNAGFGASRFGGSGIGGGGFGMSGFGGGGSVFGNQSFGSGGYGGGQAFVGRDGADMAAVFSETGRGGVRSLNQMNRTATRSNRATRPAPSVESAPQIMRVELEVGFASPRPRPAVVAASLRTRLGKILADHNIAQLAVTMEGDTAVLRGVAASDSQRLVLEKLVALEPGVRGVRNEMVVSEPSAQPPVE